MTVGTQEFRPFGYRATTHVKQTPDDRPDLDDGIISTAWNAGTLHVQYVGLEAVPKSAVDSISKSMWQFATDCQLMLVLYAGVLLSREAIQSHIKTNTDPEKPFAITSTDSHGKVSEIWAWLPHYTVLDAFSVDGKFETTFAKSFAIFAYQNREKVVRPTIAQALGTSHAAVQSDLMGEWRHLRNWLMHPSSQTSNTYFKNADLLTKIPSGPKPGNSPTINSDMVLPMMGYLSHLKVLVNPNGLSPGIKIGSFGSELATQLAEQAEHGKKIVPIWRGFEPPST